MPKVSVNLGSSRPGGIDIALAGLVNQTYTDFEVIFTDNRYHLRHERVMHYVKESGLKQPFYHVPNHRNRGDFWGTTCAGYNTGFMLSAGDIVIMLIDYAYVPPTWIETHVRHQEQPKVILGPHEYRTLIGAVPKDGGPLIDFQARRFIDDHPPDISIAAVLGQRARFDEISVFPAPFTVDQLNRFPVEASDAKVGMPTGPFSDYNYFNTKNESFPLGAILDINGMDENYDRGRGPGDPDLGLRLQRAGLEQWIVQEALVHCLNPRQIMPNINIAIPENSRLPPPYHNRWYIEDGYEYIARVKANGAMRASNPFEIRDRRRELWGWREASQERMPILPFNVVPDDLYY